MILCEERKQGRKECVAIWDEMKGGCCCEVLGRGDVIREKGKVSEEREREREKEQVRERGEGAECEGAGKG